MRPVQMRRRSNTKTKPPRCAGLGFIGDAGYGPSMVRFSVRQNSSGDGKYAPAASGGPVITRADEQTAPHSNVSAAATARCRSFIVPFCLVPNTEGLENGEYAR